MTLTATRIAGAADLRAAPRGRRRIAMPRISAATLAIALIALAGLALRLAAARGDLWLDELWSLDLVSKISSPDQVFWKISHDNNHFLNSLWMYGVGPQASPVVYRLPSVIFGTATILVAARLGARVNAAAAVAAAALTACSYPFVDYGSEARGYGGLILAILLALDLHLGAMDRLLAADRPGSGAAAVDLAAARRFRWSLAAAILFGVCSHLTMLVEAAILALATVVRLRWSGVTLRAAFDGTVGLFRPSLIVLLPLLAAVGAGAALNGGFTIGGFLPFTSERYLRGYGGLLQMCLGLPATIPNAIGLLAAAALLITAFATGLLDRRWLSYVLVAMVAWPAFVFVARIPNTEYARYFLTAGLALPIFLAEIAGRLWDRGRIGRLVALAGMAAVCAGQAPYLRELVADHRGAPAAAVALMAREGPAVFVARNGMITNPVIDVYASRIGADLRPEVRADRCAAPAAWLVYDADYAELPPDAPVLSAPGCTWRYGREAVFPAPLWSGRSWTLYRRLP